MLKRGTTKRALLLCSFSLVLCVSMFVGTTWAWFTDSAVSSENRIVSGTLDIVLEMLDIQTGEWVDAQGKVIPFVSPDTEDILWEPNSEYKLAPIRVRNSGNLSAYVTVMLNGVSGDKELLDVLDFTVSSDTDAPKEFVPTGGTVIWEQALPENNYTTDTIILSVHMLDNAPNFYQGMSLTNISITVEAIQYSYEQDSFGEYYDSEADMSFDFEMSDREGHTLENTESISYSIN